MEKEDVIKHGRRIIQDMGNNRGIFEAIEFLQNYAGKKSSFYKNINKLNINELYKNSVRESAKGCLEGFISHVENDLTNGISIERKVQLETVSDFLEQATTLLNSSDIHPAAPAMIIGAALEEFLRNWVEELGIEFDGKSGIDNYSKILKKKDLIDKQDFKDITSWAGLRNETTHGHWDVVNDKKRITLMLEGVNLFMRKHAKE